MLTVPRARRAPASMGDLRLGIANSFVNAQFHHNDSSSFQLLVSLLSCGCLPYLDVHRAW